MIAEMDRLEIVCTRTVLPGLVEALQEQGLIHIEEVPLSVEHAPGFLHRVHLDGAQQAEADALDQLHRMLLEIDPLLTIAPEREEVAAAVEALAETPRSEWRRLARGWSRDLRSLTRRHANVKDNLEVLTSFHNTLLSVEPLLEGRHVVLGKDARAFVVKGDTARALKRLQERCRHEIGPDALLFHRRVSRNALVGVVTYPEARNEAVGFILREEHIAPVDLPDKAVKGLPFHEVMANLGKTMAGQRESLAEIRAELDRFATEHGPSLRALRLMVADRVAQLSITKQFAESRMVAVIHGWVPSSDAPALVKTIRERFSGHVAIGRLPVERVERSNVPTLLRNNRVLQPFEVLLGLFRPPTYGTIDASAFVGVFFVFFYGFILGDAVYGAAVAALAWWLRRRYGANRTVRAAASVGVYMGLSSIVFGVLFGEYCGDLGHTLLGLRPIWLHRSHNAMTLLAVAVGFGAVHVVLSLIMGIREELRHRATRHALEKLGLLLGLLGVGVGVAGYAGLAPFNTVAGAVAAAALLGACVVLLLGATGAMAPVRLMEVISLVANVLSYSRLMAVGIASLALADVANELARGTHNLVIGIPVGIAIHVLNVGFGMFSPTIHSLRLNYVEALPKFYAPEGRPYQPFKKEALQ
ncbi:MAG: hypothetical protein JXR94_12605 [Candidatus Hydrogenedentes bacterium]|nr:hypothetical protein [Candidatus Hydrogenedentota bacterium]